MPRKLLVTISILFFFLFAYRLTLNASSVSALSPTSTAPTPEKPTCDRCGWCGRYDPTPKPSPYNWENCTKCLYPTPNVLDQQSYYTLAGCIKTEPGPFVQKILSIAFGVAGGLTFLSVLYGSGVILSSKGDPLNIKNGKDIITSSLIGLLLIIFSVFLLKVVGVDILKIPGFG